jgi:hypothetical protein
VVRLEVLQHFLEVELVDQVAADRAAAVVLLALVEQLNRQTDAQCQWRHQGGGLSLQLGCLFLKSFGTAEEASPVGIA